MMLLRTNKNWEVRCSHWSYDGENIDEYNRVCYSAIDKNEPYLKVYHPHKEKHSDKLLDYVVNRSVFADWFITKDVEQGKEYGWEINTQIGIDGGYHDLVVGLCALRMQYEFGNSNVFDAALNEGFTEDEAFFLFHQLMMDKDGKLYPWTGNTNHLAIAQTVRLQDLTKDNMRMKWKYVTAGDVLFHSSSWPYTDKSTLRFNVKKLSKFRDNLPYKISWDYIRKHIND